MFTGKKIKTFQERFAELVQESGKSLLQLSKELHMSNQTLSAWRSGTRSPKLPTIIAIADHFGVRLEWLMGFDTEKEEPEEEQRSIVIPNSEKFSLLVNYMSSEDYDTMLEIFQRTEERMKEMGIEL